MPLAFGVGWHSFNPDWESLFYQRSLELLQVPHTASGW
jgi:hypothetical protein